MTCLPVMPSITDPHQGSSVIPHTRLRLIDPAVTHRDLGQVPKTAYRPRRGGPLERVLQWGSGGAWFSAPRVRRRCPMTAPTAAPMTTSPGSCTPV